MEQSKHKQDNFQFNKPTNNTNNTNNQQQVPMSTTAATTFYKEDEEERPGAASSIPLTLHLKDMDIKSPTGLLLRDSTMDDDNLIESQLLDEVGEGDDRHLLDNMLTSEESGAAAGLASLYRTERIDSVKILSEKALAAEGGDGPTGTSGVLILEEEVGEVIQVGITPQPKPQGINLEDAKKKDSSGNNNQTTHEDRRQLRGILNRPPMKSKSFILQQVPPEITPAATLNPSPNREKQLDLSWSMFEKICKLGEGANGTVYKVKSLINSIFSAEHGYRIELNNPELLKKYGSSYQKQRLGINMHSAVEKSNKTRQLFAEQSYVIKEIDVEGLPIKEASAAMQEVTIMAEIDSHFVVGYFDSFITSTNAICIVMEYCQHGDLCNAIKKQNGKSFANNFLWKVFIHICLGVHYLHARNVIHRDIKSLNVFLTQDNSAKLGDFGNIKKISSSAESQREEGNGAEEGLERIGEEACEDDEVEKVGTPYYLAPELWQNKHQTKASDIWALGVVLYEMCAQKYPYDAQNIEELEEKVLTTKYKPIPQGVTKDFNMIIKQCLQKKPENRASIDEIIFSEDFQNKAKINKITLPVHLNKQKLLQKIQTKKQLDEDERRLIVDLQKRGVLKNLDLTPLLKSDLKKHNSSQNQNQQNQNNPGNAATTNHPESSDQKPSITIQTDNLSQMSPAGIYDHLKRFPKSTRRKDSGSSSQGGTQIGFPTPTGSQTPFVGGGAHHGKHASLMSGSQRKLELGEVRNSAQEQQNVVLSAAASCTPQPKQAPAINVQRPRLHNVFQSNNHQTVAHSSRDKASSTRNQGVVQQQQQQAQGQKKAFNFGNGGGGGAGDTRTAKLRAQVANKAKETNVGKSNTDRAVHTSASSGAVQIKSNTAHKVRESGTGVCITEPTTFEQNRGVDCDQEDLLESSPGGKFEEGTNFDLTEGDSQPCIPGEKDDDEEEVQVSATEQPFLMNPQTLNRKKTKSLRYGPNSDRPKLNPPVVQAQQSQTTTTTATKSGLKQPLQPANLMVRNQTQRTLQLEKQPSSNLTSLKQQTMQQYGGGSNNKPSQSNSGSHHLNAAVHRRTMMKSPSAKELGAKNSGLQTAGKVAQSQRTGIKVSTRIGGGSRLTTRPTVGNNRSPVSGQHQQAAPQRTKYVKPNSSLAAPAQQQVNGSTGKPPMIMKTSTAVVAPAAGLGTGPKSKLNMNDNNEQLRKPTGTAGQNRKATPGKKQSQQVQSGKADLVGPPLKRQSTVAGPSGAHKSSLMARARSSEASKDRAAAQKRATAAAQQQHPSKQTAPAGMKSTATLIPSKQLSSISGPKQGPSAQQQTSIVSQQRQQHKHIGVSKLPSLLKAQSQPPKLPSEEGEDDSPRPMDLEEVGEEEDFEFPCAMPGQAPMHNLRELEQRIQKQKPPQSHRNKLQVFAETDESEAMSQTDEGLQRQQHAARHRYVYDSFLQPAASNSNPVVGASSNSMVTMLTKDPSIVEDDDNEAESGNRLQKQPFPKSAAAQQSNNRFIQRQQQQQQQAQLLLVDHNRQKAGGVVDSRANGEDCKRFTLLEQAIEIEQLQQQAAADAYRNDNNNNNNVKNRQRIHSHFVDGSKSEDMLLEDIRPEDRKSVGEVLLMEDHQHKDDAEAVNDDDDDLLN